MKQICKTALIAGIGALSFFSPAPAQAGSRTGDLVLILELSTLTDGVPRQRVALYANDIDPNTMSVDDRYRLVIDGRRRKVPEALLYQLDHTRRAFSYDALSGGIETSTSPTSCLLGGPAVGDVMQARYLTYQNDQIVGDKMAPVLSRAENCLFTTQTNPVNTQAHLQAMHSLAVLQTLATLYGK